MKMRKPEKPEYNIPDNLDPDTVYIAELLCAILQDGYNLVPSYRLADCLRDCDTIVKRLTHEGVGFATRALPDFMSAFFCTLETGATLRPAGFACRRGVPSFLRGLTTEVLHEREGEALALHVIYMLCHSFKKLKGPYKKIVLRDNLRKFVSTDKAIGSIDFTAPSVAPIIETARNLVTNLFKDLNEDEIIPRPGPGATNTPRDKHERFEPHVLYDQLESVFPIDDWFYSHPWDVCTRAREYFGLAKADHPTSRFKYIHKYVNKPRGICIEENETQYLQQGIKRCMYKLIETHAMTRGRINFSSQDINRELALLSSLCKSYFTLDMSEASDRVARELVFRLFWDTPLLPYLDSLSTRVITLPRELGQGTSLFAHKFAPMGSGICFPVMSVVHWALCRAIVRHCVIGGTRELERRIYVYGDDIVAPAEAAEAFYKFLPAFGMKVNVDKSFYRSSFRESCGIHAYKGKDVTPVYNNYTLNSTLDGTDSTRLLSSIAKESRYQTFGFVRSAAVVRRYAHKAYGPIPFVDRASVILGWKRDDPTHEHVKSYARKWRYNSDTQSREYSLRTVVPRFEKSSTVEGSRGYLRWLLVAPTRDRKILNEQDATIDNTLGSDTFSGSVEDLKIVRRWIPEPAFRPRSVH